MLREERERAQCGTDACPERTLHMYETNQPYRPDRRSMVRNATQGGFALAGGIALLVFKGIISIPFVGPVIGAAMLVGGLLTRPRGMARSSDRFLSLGLVVMGGLAVATVIPVLGGLASWLMGAAGFGLVILGAVRLFQYLRDKGRY